MTADSVKIYWRNPNEIKRVDRAHTRQGGDRWHTLDIAECIVGKFAKVVDVVDLAVAVKAAHDLVVVLSQEDDLRFFNILKS